MQMSITGLVVTIAVIVLGIYDLVLVLTKSERLSASDWIIQANLRRPFIACAFGFVLGHLFGVMYPGECPPPSANILAPNFWMGMCCVTVAAYVMLWKKRK